MNAQNYKISGNFSKNGFEQTFSKELAAIGEGRALEKVYCLVGSHHRVKRRQIKITKVEALK